MTRAIDESTTYGLAILSLQWGRGEVPAGAVVALVRPLRLLTVFAVAMMRVGTMNVRDRQVRLELVGEYLFPRDADPPCHDDQSFHVD